jgi:probable HAF family extracellular repeat protein
MLIRSLLLCAPCVLIACHHGSPQMDRDAAGEDASADSPNGEPPDGTSPDGDPPDGGPIPTGTCRGLGAGLTCRTPYCVADYAMTDLGMLGAGNGSTASAIDDDGNVAGTFRPPPASTLHAFRWNARDGFVDLGTLGGATSHGLGVSGARVVGVSDLAGGGSHAFAGDDGGLRDLGTLGGTGSIARGINAAGIAVGESQLPSGVVRATRFEGAVASDLGTLAGTPTATSAALAINTSGVIVGHSDTESGRFHAARWTNGTVVDLDTIDSQQSTANAINASGDAAGYVITMSRLMPARFSGGAVFALSVPFGGGIIGAATGINDAGVIVGSSSFSTPQGTFPGPAFVLDGASVIALDDMVPFNPFLRLIAANGINNAGQIAAQGNTSAFDPGRAVILTPHCSPGPPFRSLAFAAGTTVAAPDGAAAGDLLLGALRYEGDPVVLTPPIGWSLIADQLAGAGTAEAFHLLVYVRKATAAEPAEYTFAAPEGVQVALQIAAYPALSTVESTTVVSSISSAIAPDATTTQDDAVLIGIFMRGGGGTWTQASGMLGRLTQRSNVDGISLQDELRPTAGPAGTRNSRTTEGTLAAALLVLK